MGGDKRIRVRRGDLGAVEAGRPGRDIRSGSSARGRRAGSRSQELHRGESRAPGRRGAAEPRTSAGAKTILPVPSESESRDGVLGSAWAEDPSHIRVAAGAAGIVRVLVRAAIRV